MNGDTISKLVSQHDVLKSDLSSVLDLLNGNIKKTSLKVDKLLKKFNKDLKEHWKTENDVFFPDLLKKMKNSGQDTEKTEKFIEEMKDLEKVVREFVKKFNSAKKIEKNYSECKKGFKVILKAVTVRVEAEERGPFEYWLRLWS